jgi:hypothetical protein
MYPKHFLNSNAVNQLFFVVEFELKSLHLGLYPLHALEELEEPVLDFITLPGTFELCCCLDLSCGFFLELLFNDGKSLYPEEDFFVAHKH